MQTQVAQPQYVITEQDKKRQQRIADAWTAYDGLLPPPLEPMPEEDAQFANIMSNRCRPIVDRGVDFLFGKPVEISVDQGSPQEAQDFLDDTWGKDEARIPLLQKYAMSGAIAGQAFLRIVPNRDGSFRLVVVDPATVSVQTAPQDCETVLLYCIEYSCNEQIGGKDVQRFYREEIRRIDPDQDAAQGLTDFDATWEIQHWTRVGDRGVWQPAGDPIAWPYVFPPIFSNQNLPNPHDFWGYPDLTPDLIQINNGLNFVQSNTNRIIKLYGAPILYAPGAGAGVIDISPGHIIQLPLDTNTIAAVAIQSDLANALAFAANLRTDMDEQSAVPAVALGRQQDLPKGQISGVTLELLFMPLLAKTEKKRCLYGETMLDVSNALLQLATPAFSSDIDVSLTWSSPIPHDDLQSAQAALAKQQAGASKYTTLLEMGLDPDEEAERNKTEGADAVVAASRGQGMPPANPMMQQPQPPTDQPQEQGVQQ